MIGNAAALVQLWITSIWNLATGWNLPGVNFNFAEFIFFIVFFGLVVKTFFRVLSIFGNEDRRGK